MFHISMLQETREWSRHTSKPIDLSWLYIKVCIDSCKLFHIWLSFPLKDSYKDIDLDSSE